MVMSEFRQNGAARGARDQRHVEVILHLANDLAQSLAGSIAAAAPQPDAARLGQSDQNFHMPEVDAQFVLPLGRRPILC